MAIHPLLPVLLLASLAGLVPRRLVPGWTRRRGSLDERLAAGGVTWALLGLAATALLAPALALPDGIPSPAATLARDAPWQGTGAPAEGNPALRDVTHQIQPWLLHLRGELRAGRLPLWNPYQFSGTPFWSNGQTAPLFPLHLLFAALPLPAGWVLLPWLRWMIAGMGARALARALGLSEPAARVAAIVYPLSGMLVGFALYPMGNALALVPWVLWAVEWLAAGRSAVAPLALATGLQLLSGHPGTAMHTALLTVLYLAVRGTAPGVRGVAAWARLGAGWALGAALAAVQLVPFALTLLESSRWWAEAGTFAEPLGRLLTQPLRLLLPELYGNPAHGTWFGPYNYLATAVYVGVAALPLAAVGVGRIVQRSPAGEPTEGNSPGADPDHAVEKPPGTGRAIDRRWLAVAALLVFAFAAAYHLPGVRELIGSLPVVGRAPLHRLIFGVELALALLVAAGWERWRAGAGGRALVAGSALAALLVAAAWLLFAGGWAERGLVAGRAARTVAILAAATLLLAALRLPARRRHVLAALVPALFATDLVLAHAAVNPGLAAGRLYPETPAVRFLQEREGRVAGAGRTLHPNAATVYRLFDVRGDDPIKLAAYERRFAERFGAGHPTYFVPIRRWDPEGLDRLGVRWVMTGPGEPAPVETLRLAYDGADARVYERPGALPLVRWSGGGGEGFAVTVLDRRPGRWRVRWTAPEPGLLVIAESYDAGWSARTAAGPVPVRAADEVLLGIELGPGEGTLELDYRPAGIRWGAAASAAGLAALLVLTVAGRRRTALPAGGKGG